MMDVGGAIHEKEVNFGLRITCANVGTQRNPTLGLLVCLPNPNPHHRHGLFMYLPNRPEVLPRIFT